MKKFTFCQIFVAVAATLFSVLPAQAQNAPIGCNGQFFISHGTAGTSTSTTSLDKLTFSGSTITSASYATNPTGIGYNAIGLNPVDGYMYGLRYPASGARVRLVKVGNGTPNNVTDLGLLTSADLSTGDVSYAGCFDAAGKYYFITDADELFTITGLNSPTAVLAAVKVGNVNPATSGIVVDIAIDPTDGQMYGVSLNQVVYKINKATGATTVVGTHAGTQYIAALFFDEVGNLFGYRQDGTFQKINKTNATLTQVGTAPTYTYADGCSCSFGRVFHDLDFTANPGNQLCPTVAAPNPTFPLVVTVTNQTPAQQTGLTYTLNISDADRRLRFTESAATIKANLITAGVATAASTVTLSTVAPATGTNYNKVVVTGFQTGAASSALAFTLQVQLYTLGGSYPTIPLQSEITGLAAAFGPNDLSNDPGTIAPDDPTVINFCPNITLPVKLVSFTGAFKNNATTLNWVTENQTNLSYFDVERSTNGADFTSLTWKNAQTGNTARQLYSHNDDLTFAGGNTFYYRLKIVDVDGSFKYSNVIMIRKTDNAVDALSITPNPVKNAANATVRISATVNGKADLSVVDMAGRIVLSQQEQLTEGLNSITLNNLNHLQAGLYLLKVNNGETVVSTKFYVAH